MGDIKGSRHATFTLLERCHIKAFLLEGDTRKTLHAVIRLDLFHFSYEAGR